jgi:GNAT superfamily N-acetyltransferase
MVSREHRLLCCFNEDDGEGDTVTLTEFKVVIEDSTRRIVGLLEGQVAHFSKGAGFIDFDDHSQTLSDIWCLLFEDGRPLSFMADAQAEDFLYLDRMKLLPDHRGQKIGLKACAATMALLSGKCSTCCIKPWPLQWAGKLGEDAPKSNQQQFKKDQQKLISYYKPLGFRRIREANEYFVRDLSPNESILGFQNEDWSPCGSNAAEQDINWDSFNESTSCQAR